MKIVWRNDTTDSGVIKQYDSQDEKKIIEMKRKKSLEMSGLVASTISQIRKVFANKKFRFKGSSKSWPMHENDTASLECLVPTLFILNSPL